MIKVDSLSYEFETRNGLIKVLDNISFEIKRGELVSIIGPSGCGKSTLLRLISGLMPVQSGTITMNGIDSSSIIKNQLYSIIFQEVTLLDWLTIKKNIELPVKLNPKMSYVSADELINSVELGSYKDMYPKQLSGGMKTRVGIARAMMLKTPVLLMDECFASLDEVTRENMNTFLLSTLDKYKKTLLLITHSIAEAVFISDRVLVFSQKPAKIIDDIKISIPKPRRLEDMENREYTHYRKIIREALDFASD